MALVLRQHQKSLVLFHEGKFGLSVEPIPTEFSVG